MHTLAIGGLGTWEMVVILAVVLLVFGARRLPELARSMGTSITQFKKGLRDDPDLLDSKDDDADDDDDRPRSRSRERDRDAS